MGAVFTNIFGFLISIFIGMWVIAIFVVTSPKERLERACGPVGWTGKFGTSLAMLMDDSEKTVKSTQEFFDSATYGCQFTLWRVFYEEDWKKEQAALQRQEQELQEAASKKENAKPAPPVKRDPS
jgi:hypothetical protein